MFSFYIFPITLPAVRISLLFKSELWYSRFYWSRSTKDPADPYWFVVVLPSQVFLSYHQLPSPQSINYRALHQHAQLQIFRETFSWWLLFRFWPPWEIVIDSFSVTCLLFNLLERLSSVAMWAGIYVIGRIKREDTSVTQKGRRRNLVSQAWAKLLLFFNQILSFCKRPEQRKDKDRTRTVTFVACYTFCLVA